MLFYFLNSVKSGDGSSDLMWDEHAEENRNAVFESTGCLEESDRLQCLRSKVDFDQNLNNKPPPQKK